jgi:predicted amidohydrolase
MLYTSQDTTSTNPYHPSHTLTISRQSDKCVQQPPWSRTSNKPKNSAAKPTKQAQSPSSFPKYATYPGQLPHPQALPWTNSLPQAADYITTSGGLKLCRSVHDSEFLLGLCASAKKYSLPISVGVHEPTSDAKKVKNTLLWITSDGEITHRYQKLHLFDMNVKDGPQMQESAGVERGLHLGDPFDSPVGKLGMQICFDLRFPEPGLALRRRGAEVLLYPAAFTTPTGKAGHWEILIRARAIETQSYVIAAAQVGVHDDEGKRRSWGHSMIVDPWGKIVAELGGDEGEGGKWKDEGEIATADIDLEFVRSMRNDSPLKRRTDVYAELV